MHLYTPQLATVDECPFINFFHRCVNASMSDDSPEMLRNLASRVDKNIIITAAVGVIGHDNEDN